LHRTPPSAVAAVGITHLYSENLIVAPGRWRRLASSRTQAQAFLRYPQRNLTPGPPPFSSMNSTPADSSAFRRAARVEPCATRGPGLDSNRLMVGSDTEDAFARSRCSHRNRARAARINSLLSERAAFPT